MMEKIFLDKSVIDGTIPIKTKDAISRMKNWEDTGILVGISSGANILAAEKYLDMYDPEGIVLTILGDRERDISNECRCNNTSL